MSRKASYQLLDEIAGSQWGLITATQAGKRGVTANHLARLAKDGVIRQVRHGVYALGGAPATWLEDVRAEWLATDPGLTLGERSRDAEQVVVADETAAAIHGFGDFTNDTIRLASPERRRTTRPFVRIALRQMSEKEWTTIDGLPVTSPRRTLEDLVRSGRWEAQHLADAIDDAITASLLSKEDVERSKVLMGVVPELAPPASHRSVLALLKQDAVARGVAPQTAQDGFFRFLFTAALMQSEPGWVVKGGSGMMCRFTDARNTHDIDLFREGSMDHTASAHQLAELMDGSAVGGYAFACQFDPRASREDGNTSSIKVQATSGAQVVSRFTIDVSDRIVLENGPETRAVSRPDTAVIKGYPRRATVNLYPVENQIADKVGAMYSRYHGGVSTRYHDLYDVAMLADRTTIDPVALQAALLNKERRMFGARLPEQLTPPDAAWPTTYNKAMEKTAGAIPPYSDYDEAMRISAPVIDPVLKAIAESRPIGQPR